MLYKSNLHDQINNILYVEFGIPSTPRGFPTGHCVTGWICGADLCKGSGVVC